MDQHLKDWCKAPWHSWLKEEPKWCEIFAEFWAMLPSNQRQQVLSNAAPLVVLPPVNIARAIVIPQGLPQGVRILQLDHQILKRPRLEALAIVAHEIAHLVLPPTSDPLTNDLAADKLVIQWGFREGLAKALQKDLSSSSPRRWALE